jgi:hypothetical protein
MYFRQNCADKMYTIPSIALKDGVNLEIRIAADMVCQRNNRDFDSATGIPK